MLCLFECNLNAAHLSKAEQKRIRKEARKKKKEESSKEKKVCSFFSFDTSNSQNDLLHVSQGIPSKRNRETLPVSSSGDMVDDIVFSMLTTEGEAEENFDGLFDDLEGDDLFSGQM